jgi:sigma-B regulation protein RsbU (phosphoserine phosphatase)
MPTRASEASTLGRACREALDGLAREGASVALVERLSGLVGLLEDEIRNARRALAAKSLALGSLFDASQELTAGGPEEAVLDSVLTSAMGHFVVSRAAVYVPGADGLALARSRGLHRAGEGGPVLPADARREVEDLSGPVAVADMPDGVLRRKLVAARLALAVPLADGGPTQGLLAIGERASGAPFSAEDREVARALARQARAAVENARLRLVREEKKRQDRELQIAREIQESLLPPRAPVVPGFEMAGRSRPCYEVGGDSYDWIPLGDGRLALTVGDVAGKGTPASLLMASVHASVQLLAGTATPETLAERLNRFLVTRAPASRFVTLFYGELDPLARRLVYVNAGHVPPFRVASDGSVVRLPPGGPALGLIPDATYEKGELALAPGDLVAVVTDGVTEAASPEDEEFGDERVCDAMRALAGSGADAEGVLHGLLAAVERWTGEGRVGDDLTAVILRARG